MTYQQDFYDLYDVSDTGRKVKAYTQLVADACDRYLTLNGTKRRRVLDVGCADGRLLAGLAEAGFDAAGIDVSPYLIKRVKTSTVAETVVYDIQGPDEPPFAPESFDLVTMLSVIAHISRPLDALQRVNRLLRPGGLLVMTTANPNSIVRFLRGRKWVGAAAEDHVLLYTPFTLRFALSRQGFATRELMTPQIHPFSTRFSLPLGLLRLVLHIPYGANTWVVAQKT